MRSADVLQSDDGTVPQGLAANKVSDMPLESIQRVASTSTEERPQREIHRILERLEGLDWT